MNLLQIYWRLFEGLNKRNKLEIQIKFILPNSMILMLQFKLDYSKYSQKCHFGNSNLKKIGYAKKLRYKVYFKY